MNILDPTRAEHEQTLPEELAAPVAEQSETETGQDGAIQLQAGSLLYNVARKLQSLPYETQQEVLDFVEFLAQKSLPTRPRRSFLGALSHLNISCTEQDIAEARREMWGNFPRELPDD